MNKPTYKTKFTTSFREDLPKRIGRWPRMETWQTIPDGFQHVGSGRILTAEEFEKYQYSLQEENVGFIIKAMK